VVVSSLTKETNRLTTLPASVSFLSAPQIDGLKIINIKDFSSMIPNFYIPDYGSRMTVPVYVRGIGERSTGQTIGLYVDNMPYLDKSAFDFNFSDIQRIEILRGPQGTLFGRNAMGGIIHIYTRSPLDCEHTKVMLTGGNHGLFRANAGVSRKLSDRAGLSVSGYYDRNSGFFNNRYHGKKEDQLNAAGARIRLDWTMANNWAAQLMANYDYTDQGAFPYGVYENGKVNDPDFDAPGSYLRQVVGGNLNLNHKNDLFIFNSTTSWQYLDDDMHMDIDNSPQSVFTNNQKQYLNSFTEELTLRSNTSGNYQWSFGLFGFSNDMNTNVLTTMHKDGIQTIMQSMFDRIHANNPHAPVMTVKNTEIPMPGSFQTPAYGGAIFHQSTYSNLFFEGLSVTAGVRIDYEKIKLKYNMNIGMDLDVKMGNRPPVPMQADTLLQGAESMSFTEILPKIAVKYEFNDRNYIYATVANGYKAGGYNIQMFADIAQQALRAKYSNELPVNMKDAVQYKPEYSWNYEIGFKAELIPDILYGEFAAFYIDVRDIQLTKFVNSGHGRMLSNAGKSASKGFDISLSARLFDGFGATANYGYTHAAFQKNDSIDYGGNYIPYAPQHTLSVGASYIRSFRNRWIDRINLQAQYNAAGKIYWTVDNNISQQFYGNLHLKAGAGKGIFEAAIWTKNTLNTDYTAFYFESMGRPLAQKGKPFQIGVDLSVRF
jgi:outer membrane receptor protein involved in Fe transport